MLKRCYGVTFNTPDVAGIRAFYVDMLGCEIIEEQPGRFLSLECGGVPLRFEAFYKKPDSWAELRFETEDVPHFCARLRAAGHNIPREWADKAELVDPDGRKIIVTQSLW